MASGGAEPWDPNRPTHNGSLAGSRTGLGCRRPRMARSTRSEPDRERCARLRPEAVDLAEAFRRADDKHLCGVHASGTG